MDFQEVIAGRRSIRKYLDKDVPDELLDEVLEAVRWTPSGGNIQPWEVIVVRDPETKNRLQETLGGYNPARKAIVAAPLLLVLCAKEKIPDTYRKAKDIITKFAGDLDRYAAEYRIYADPAWEKEWKKPTRIRLL